MTTARLVVLSLLTAVLAWGAQAPPQRFVPAPVKASDITVRAALVGRMPTHKNPTSPVVAGSHLLLIDQAETIYVWNNGSAQPALTMSTAAPAVKFTEIEPVLNAAATPDGSRVYVMFVSAVAPDTVPRRTSPKDGTDAWYLLYAFDFDGATLTNGRPVTAMQVRTDGHTGGGMALLEDGSVIFTPGDNGDSYEDGRGYSPNPDLHLAKIVRIDPANGSTRILAVGVRAAQRVIVSGRGAQARVTFVDPGGWVSEELNSVRVADLLNAPSPLNFGWGRSPVDGKAREGTFYINEVGDSVGVAPPDEPGFVQPIAELGREAASQFAISGPVASVVSFSRITFLFGDLVSGALFATTSPATVRHQDVFHVAVVDSSGAPTTLKDLAGGARPDPRFFNFPDGSAGVLLERTGEFFRLTEIKRAAPSPAPGARRP